MPVLHACQLLVAKPAPPSACIADCALTAGMLCCAVVSRRWPKTIFLKALGPFLACVIGILVVVAGKWTNGKGPIKVSNTKRSPSFVGVFARGFLAFLKRGSCSQTHFQANSF